MADMAERMNNTRWGELTGTLMLLLASLVWGATFAAQDVAAEQITPLAFLMCRSWISFFLLLPVTALLAKRGIGSGDGKAVPRKELVLSGVICGSLLFFASFSQQYGIAFTTTAKSSFITALYCVIVPVIYAIMKRGLPLKLWGSVVLAVVGLYLLSITGPLILSRGDAFTLLCAFLFSLQILSLDRFAGRIGGLRIVTMEFLVTALWSTALSFILEHPTFSMVRAALPSILFAGCLSGGIGYTFQAVAQTRVNPALASITMSLESVFGALAGWAVLHQALSLRELAGCILMFAAIILAELPLGKKDRIQRQKGRSCR